LKSSCGGKFGPPNGISLTVRKVDLLVSASITQGSSMFGVIAAFFIVLSVGILIAHALDAFRSRPGPKAKTQQRS